MYREWVDVFGALFEVEQRVGAVLLDKPLVRQDGFLRGGRGLHRVYLRSFEDARRLEEALS